MKKILIAAGLIILIAVAGWFVWRGYNRNQENNDISKDIFVDVNSVASSTDNVGSSIAATSGTAQSDALKTLALSIISKPIVFKTNLSESGKNFAREKIEAAIKMIKDNYDYDLPWLDLGAYRKLIGDYDGAIDAWNFLLKIRPHSYVASNNLGDLYGFILKNYPKAEENFLKSLEENPNNINGYVQLATIYEYWYKEKSGNVEPLFLAGIENNPTDVSLKIALAEYYERAGRKADAIKYFEEALKLNPSNVSVSEELAKLKAGL